MAGQTPRAENHMRSAGRDNTVSGITVPRA